MKFKIALGLIFFLAVLVLFPNSQPKPQAQTTSCTANTPRAEGLISAPQLSPGNKFGNSSGICIIDPKAAFAPYKIPTYDDLKSLYFDQLKTSSSIAKEAKTGNKNQGDISFSGSDRVYHIKKTSSSSVDGDLTIEGPITPVGSGGKTGVVFVEGNLNINTNITYREGLVFIVKGNVNIDPTVATINAIIIADGTIYTAGANCLNSSVSTTSALTINGSLVSLTESSPAKFCRTLADNTDPAEVINHQVKYLVILRNLMSDTFQRWSEIP